MDIIEKLKVRRRFINTILGNPVFITFAAFIILLPIVVLLTKTFVKGGYHNRSFIENILLEAHGMLIDILIIGAIIFALHRIVERRLDKKRNIERWHEEIYDFREWESEEAKHRILGNIKRLNKVGITKISLYGCFLKKAKFMSYDIQEINYKRGNIVVSKILPFNLFQSVFDRANLEEADLAKAALNQTCFNSANLSKANLRNAKLVYASLQEANLQDACLINADLKNADLRVANLINANLNEADLSYADLFKTDITGANLCASKLQGARGLTIEQLSKARTLYKCVLDIKFENQIKEIYPHLFEKPKDE